MASTLPPVSEILLKQFILERVLNEDPVTRQIILLGLLPAGPQKENQPAIIQLTKTAFGDGVNAVRDWIHGLSRVSVIDQNDVYGEALGWHSSTTEGEPGCKISLVLNATPEHIAKKTKQKPILIRETPQTYRDVMLPYIDSIPKKRIQWVYNILSHETESEKIVFEDASPTSGFIILPDFKWDRVTMSALYLVAIVHSEDIRSLRDLRKNHIAMLKNIRREAARSCEAKWGVGKAGLKMYLHYLPSYYHLHVHIVSAEMEGWPGMNVGHAHLVDDVISLLETEPEGVFERMTLTYTVTDLHPLAASLQLAQDQVAW
ncbi:hypothetical protein FRB98_002457 [Tulasnella sp. 332]|nr:hypothetical protein FRB98_002457 [Tulasnella sp. 332]